MHPTAAAAYSAPPLPSRLGEGGFGTVFNCKLDGRDAVAKQIGRARLGAKDLPLLQNDAQLDILKKIESNDCVVVQGPPGTGKSHTIGEAAQSGVDASAQIPSCTYQLY